MSYGYIPFPLILMVAYIRLQRFGHFARFVMGSSIHFLVPSMILMARMFHGSLTDKFQYT